MLALRPYQRDAVDAVFSAHRRGMLRPATVMFTGAGKTVVLSHLSVEWLAANPGKRVLILVHTQELLDQAISKLRSVAPGLSVGAVQADRNETLARVIVATVQTLRSETRRRMIRDVGLIIVDECHHAVAVTYRAIMNHFGCLGVPPGTAPRSVAVGYTATMIRGDDLALGDVWQDVVYQRTITEGIADGALVRPRGIHVQVDDLDLSQVRTTRGDYREGDLGQAIENSLAPAAIAKAVGEHAADRKILLFAPTVHSAGVIADALSASGRPTGLVHGGLGNRERRAVLDAFRAGDTPILANCLDAQTEILTRRGWVGPHEIRIDDETAAMDRATGQLRWEIPSQIIRRARGGDERMVAVKNQGLDIRVTEGHRMLARTTRGGRWNVNEARDLPIVQSSYELPTSVLGDDVGVDLTCEEIEFLGLFATDGSLNRDRASLEIAQSASSVVRGEIERILTACGFDWKMSEYRAKTPAGDVRDYVRYRIPKGSIGGQLRRSGWGRLSGWLDKSLSPRLSECTRVQFAALMHGIWVGDGLKRSGPGPTWTIYGIDGVMFDRLQAWAAVRGYASSCMEHPNTGGGRLKVLRVRDRLSVRTNNAKFANPARFESGWREEMVWCVTNESGTIVTRRGGKVIVMGQCMVLTEGFDEPAADCLVLARPTKSLGLYIQMAGRVLRPYPGKTDALILDVVGATKTHALVSGIELFGEQAPKSKKDIAQDADELDLDADLDEGQQDARHVLGAADGPLVATEVDLFAGSAMAWLRTRAGVFFLPAGDRYIAILPGAPRTPEQWMASFEGRDYGFTGYDVISMHKDRLHTERVIVAGVEDLAYAMAWAEGDVTATERTVAARERSWRARVPSPKMAAFAARLGLPVSPHARAGEVSNMITLAVGTRRIDGHLPEYLRRKR